MGNRGYIALSRGDLDEAAAFFEESFRLASAESEPTRVWPSRSSTSGWRP